MKSILIMLTSLTCFAMATNAQINSTADDNSIRELVKTMEDGWTKKDGALFAKPFAEDADYVIINGMYIKGKTAIANGHQMIFNTFYKETNITTGVKSIRYIRPDIAVVHVTSHMGGVSNGKPVDTNAIITLTVEKSSAGWQIAAFQNTEVGKH